MAKVDIFWRAGCGFCTRVKNLMEEKGVEYTSFNIWEDDNAKAEMKSRIPTVTTVPQVFVDGGHIGGCDDTLALESSGKLDALLKK